ncbi:MAG: hypothetical protein KGZ85_07095 [Ignavibacterium sp.]|nr:hypothetical protein [Ignavibacterium sp.]
MKNIFVFILFFSITLHSQSVFEPVDSEIYDFLERQSVRGVINYNSEIKPLLRSNIGSLLIELEEKKNLLTNLDKDLLRFYLTDYEYEIGLLSNSTSEVEEIKFLTLDREKRVRLFEYTGKNFALFADPMLAFSYGKQFDEYLYIRRNGFRTHAYASSNWGINLRFFDNEETGNRLDEGKYYTHHRGVVITKIKPDAIEYDEVNAGITYAWQTGSLSFAKEYFKIGSGKLGQIILSDKAPSFPFIRLDYYPVDWMRFIYFHGFLVSNVPDSSTFRFSQVPNRTTIADVPKFIAFHMLSVYPTESLSISIGESIVYSEYVQPVYFIPIMFFRVADHYLGRTNASASGNAQMFADLSYRWTEMKTRFYGSIFIDELSLNKLFKGENHSAIGFTTGAEIFDPVLNNSLLNIEYTRINPFVYMNSVDAQQFANEFYKLGHWIESNGDIISVKYEQYILRSLKFSITGWYMRKGAIELPEEQYQSPYPPFLYGERRNDLSVNFNISYSPFHPLYTEVYFNYRDISDNDLNRTALEYSGKFSDFGFSVAYGF